MFKATLAISLLSLFTMNIQAQQCQSDLYVSGIHVNKRTSNIPSLTVFFSHYQRQGISITTLQNLASESGLFSNSDLKKALSAFEMHKLAQQPNTQSKPDIAMLRQKFQQLLPFNRDVAGLIEAVNNGDIAPDIDLTVEPGIHKSLIDFLFESRQAQFSSEDIKQLIDAGVPVYPNAIFNAITSPDSDKLLPVLLQSFDDSDRDFVFKNAKLGSGSYTYASYAAIFGSYQSLEWVLMSGIGNTNSALEQFLMNKINNPDDLNQPQPSELNKIFNKKLALMLDHGLQVSPQTAALAHDTLGEILQDNKPRLAALADNKRLSNDEMLSKAIKTEALDYLHQLKSAKQSWPSFIFSYDKNCKKLAHDTHYRVDNLLNKSALNKLVKKHQSKGPEQTALQLKRHGDIYYDWYRLQIATVEAEPTLDKQSRKVMRELYKLIATAQWDKVDDILYSPDLSQQQVELFNRSILHVGLTAQAPPYIIENWLQRGAILDSETTSMILAKPEYTSTVIDLMKKRKFPKSSHKSAIYQAASSGNLELVKAIYRTKKLDENYFSDEGLTSLSWTLLNFKPQLRRQLKLLLKHNPKLTNIQKQLVTKTRLSK